MIIDTALLDSLSAQAKDSPRLRKLLDLGEPDSDWQRVLNAIEPGSAMPVHRHPERDELMVALRGRLALDFFDDGGRLFASYELTPGGGADAAGVPAAVVPAVVVPAGTWHMLRSLESGSVLLAARGGRYAPNLPEDVMEVPAGDDKSGWK